MRFQLARDVGLLEGLGVGLSHRTTLRVKLTPDENLTFPAPSSPPDSVGERAAAVKTRRPFGEDVAVNFFETVADYIFHLDRHVAELVQNYGGWALLILFLIIFCETGLVVTPFLQGDSLLFAAGAIAATGALNVGVLILLLIVAAILGDSTNYWLGSRIGTRVFKENARVLKTEYLRRTQDFFARYGSKTIIIARFVPIVRTYAPFVAGVVGMSYQRFLTVNVLGGVAWILIFVMGGFLFGEMRVVEDNFTLVILVVILLSVAPMIFEYSRTRRARRISARKQAAEGQRSDA